MTHNNNHNFSCNFSEQLISFVYDEIGGAEKSDFESHLQHCTSCASEISNFTSVRSSIQEWHLEDFAHLSTPAIELPLAKNNSAISNNWLEKIRALFSFRPILISAAMALMLVVAGFFWFRINPPGAPEIASNNSDAKITARPPANEQEIIDTSAVAEINGISEQKVSEPVKKVLQSEKDNAGGFAATNKKAEDRIINKNPPRARKYNAAVASRNNDKATQKTPDKTRIPSISSEEYEDKSLRLSDMFKEVSLK